MKATLCIDKAVGEDRRALLDPFGRPFRLEIERWSERGKRAKLDEVWWGRTTARLPGGSGWFVDLGLDAASVIEATRSRAIVEGALLPVRIKAEAWGGKGPLLSLADMSPDTPRPGRPGRHAEAPDPFLARCEVVATISGAAARREIAAAIDEALQAVSPIPDGGDICIERTRALTAIDVDTAARKGVQGDAFPLALNLAAAEEAARQIALRGIGGLVVVDFVSMAAKKDRTAVVEGFRSALAEWLGRVSDVSELSAFGLCEAAIARRSRPVAEALTAAPAEREGLDALRLIESEGWSAAGARIRARVSSDAMAWLDADAIGWKSALADRIGPRWVIEAVDRPPGRRPEVWSLK